MRKLMKERGFDGLYLDPGPNMYYLMGFQTFTLERLTAGIIPLEGDPVLIVPRLDEEKAQLRSRVKDIRSYLDVEDPFKLVQEALEELNLLRGVLGVEDQLPFKEYRQLAEMSPSLEVRSVSALLYEVRRVKSREEIEYIEKALEIVGAGIEAGLEHLEAGRTEVDLAFEVERAMKMRGAESVPFNLILTGKNSAQPHALPGESRVREGDVVVFDVIATYRGYYADITRTAFVGKPTTTHRRIYEVLLEAQLKAIETVRVGVKACVVDKAARDAIREAGYGDYFIHRTGHGLGLEVHEEPYIREDNEEMLEEGMVFTVEPGIYLPGKFGIRIEDNIAVDKGECIVLGKIPKNLESMVT
ncbi:MAG: M24 family metallopeptidase [Candidatus Bathyarchaeia archaeon]